MNRNIHSATLTHDTYSLNAIWLWSHIEESVHLIRGQPGLQGGPRPSPDFTHRHHMARSLLLWIHSHIFGAGIPGIHRLATEATWLMGRVRERRRSHEWQGIL